MWIAYKKLELLRTSAATAAYASPRSHPDEPGAPGEEVAVTPASDWMRRQTGEESRRPTTLTLLRGGGEAPKRPRPTPGAVEIERLARELQAECSAIADEFRAMRSLLARARRRPPATALSLHGAVSAGEGAPDHPLESTCERPGGIVLRDI